MNNNKKICKITIIIFLLTILTKIFGAGRDLALSYFYGSTSISDAYILATTLPITIFAFIFEGIGATFIPACAKLKTNEEKNKLTSNIINIVLLLTLLFVIFIEIFPKFTIKIFASGFGGETLNLAILLTRMSILGVFFSGIVYVFSYYLNYNDSFIVPTLRAIPKDIIVIISIIISAYTKKILPLAIGIPLSLFVELIFLIPSMHKKGYKYKFIIDFKSDVIKYIISWALPIIISTAVADLNTIIDRQFASWFIDGGISSLTYADRTLNVIRTSLFIPIITILFPMFSKKINDGEKEKISKMSSDTISILILIAIPISFGAFYLSNDVIRLLFERGAFDSQATLNTSLCFQYYSLALVGYAITTVTTKLFYALTDMKTPMYISIVGVIANTILNFVFSKIFGLKGLALSTSVSTMLMAIIQYIILNKKIKFNNKKILKNIFKSFIASVLMTLVIMLLKHYVISEFHYILQLIILTLIGMTIYGLLLIIFKVEDLSKILKLFKKESRANEENKS